jgi:hypothetical protein
MPPGGGVSGPRTTMSGRRPDNERVQEPTISGDAFDRRDQRPLYRGPSMLSQIVSADEHLEGVEDAEKHSRLVHIVHILRENSRIGQLSANDVKPVSDFIFDVPAISFPIDRSQPSRFQLRVSSVKALRPILAWRSDLEISVCDLENRGSLAHDDQGERL